MKHFSITTTLLATLFFGNVAGCASTATQDGVGQYVDDSAITAGVKAAVINDPSLKVAEINVETHQGVVQLSGFVSSADNVATASSVARTVKGVKSVKNDLRLK
jgi:osmotically-inducible protein OsmY